MSATCSSCGHVAVRWIGKCPQCDAWATMRSSPDSIDPQILQPASGVARSRLGVATAEQIAREYAIPADAPPGDDLPDAIPITQVDLEDIEARYTTGIEPLDRVLGGGFVIGAPVLLSAEPGRGKSTLLLQALAGVSKWHELRVLYAAGEEAIPMIAARAKRLNATYDQILIVRETNPVRICALAARHEIAMVVIDSINTSCMPDGGAPGSTQQIGASTKYLSDYAHATGTSMILVGQVTKDGGAAGPKSLQHDVDVTLELDWPHENSPVRILRAHKNRHGDTQEIGVFRMTAKGLIADDLPLLESNPDSNREPSDAEQDDNLPIGECAHLWQGDTCAICGLSAKPRAS